VSDDPILESVLELIEGESDPVDRDPLSAFAKAYISRLPRRSDHAPARLYAEVASLFDFIRQRSGEVEVRVFNPSLAEHGYETAGTVIEVNVADAPFLLDSVSNEVQAHGLAVVQVTHPVIGVERDATGALTAVRHARHTISRESVQHYELDRRLFEADLPALAQAIGRVLGDVGMVVRDFHPMLARVDRLIDLVRVSIGHYPEGDIDEAVAFLHWLKQDNFVLLGYREYQLLDGPEGEAVQVVPGTGLGLLAEESRSNVASPVPLAELAPELAERYRQGDLLVITKTNRVSPVHRRAKMDYIGVRILGPEGRTKGEARLVGLFTSKAYMEPAAKTPIIRRKLADIISAEDLIEGSHDHKAMVELLEGFSKHDLFAAPAHELRATLVGLVALQEQNQVRLFVRRDLLERSIHVLVALPRDRFNAGLRKNLQDLLVQRYNGVSADYHLALGHTDAAQIHFTIWVEGEDIPEVPFHQLEAEVVAMTRSWTDRLITELATRVPAGDAHRLAETWGPRFPEYYSASMSVEIAAGDLLMLDALERSDRPALVGIQNETEREQIDRLTRVTLYRKQGKRPLNELMPALVDLGLEVVEEVPTRLSGVGDFFIHDFGVLGPGHLLVDLDDTAERLRHALELVWSGASDSDDLNRLLIVGGLSLDQIEILRAYRTYWRRVLPVFTVAYVNNTLVSHVDITVKLVELFESRFHPAADGAGFDDIRQQILADLDRVPSLEEDRILRSFLRLIEATVRTNAYRSNRQALSFKLRSADVPDVPLPLPLFEVFVVAPTVEGIHLRAGMVARGGIRWSTRREDYRTEVLGLMKAQVTKNAVIVPSGAKGGFVLRQPPEDPTELRVAVEEQYRIFIGALLDVTDNLVDGTVVHPSDVRVHDGEDPYLVVAADKGTATFSDTANAIAGSRSFWLDDAFASGGSAGYDHKAIGITARGAWESLKRHFLELGLDPSIDEFTAVGIGDMSGDVFGNGMLGSDRIRLVAAFDHRHIFLDPDPDAAASFAERSRLFALPRSSWDDYDRSLLSEGGAIHSRSLKRIDISPQMAEVLGVTGTVFAPNDLIRAILSAPVDLLWNGGIGTYVKASHESHADVGDRTNDPVRVDGATLRARVLVEGGNLGLTQAGRIEYAARGGRINTDFIDNSGGVDCSDREVNLKILLTLAEKRARIDREARDELISAVVDDVVEAILYDNYQQAQMLSQEESSADRRMEAYEELMVSLEERGMLDRSVEGLPSTELMTERTRAGQVLTRPELSVLLAYAKRSVKESVLASNLPDDPYLVGDLRHYFPVGVVDLFGDLLVEHPLKRELVTNALANDVVNSEGIVFVERLTRQTGADPAEVVAAYRVARDVTRAVDRWEAIEQAFGVVPMDLWTRLMQVSDRSVAAVTRWFLAHGVEGSIGEMVETYRPGFEEIERCAFEVGPEEWRINRSEAIARLREAGVSESLARRHAALPVVVYGADVIDVAMAHGRDVEDTLDIFLRVGRSLGLDQLTDLTRGVIAETHWQRWALWTVEEEMLAIRRRAAERVIEVAGTLEGDEAVKHFLSVRSGHVSRLVRFMRSFDITIDGDVSPLVVALRQVRAALS
jgi:glutamate dehydrogenase